jgi:hypothetical protein
MESTTGAAQADARTLEALLDRLMKQKVMSGILLRIDPLRMCPPLTLCRGHATPLWDRVGFEASVRTSTLQPA